MGFSLFGMVPEIWILGFQFLLFYTD